MAISKLLLAILGIFAVAFIAIWVAAARNRKPGFPSAKELAIGFVTNFFDALGIGSFATTTSLFKLWHVVPDENIPGTLNVGLTIPGVIEAFIFISIVNVDPTTLVLLIAAAVAGAWLGSGVVAHWPRRNIQVGMGTALLVAATLFTLSNLKLFPGGGTALGLDGVRLWSAVGANFCLGALMTLGIGLFAPCMIVVSLLGMNPIAAFPIMMSSTAFLMPVASTRFIKFDRYALRASLGLALAGVPAVLIAAFLVKSLPLTTLRWLVVIVVTYTAVAMLRSAKIVTGGTKVIGHSTT
ncbi:MAG TPA: sulfite exporter TauE/SafE family protein [Candidatus Eremiobacteraceae bacterium]|nr:sulfite exporter TauE/SafE family protein [Candidatus Eremiobacteraceae bacterium]